MNVYEFFIGCEKLIPEKLARMRDVGSQSLAIIDEVIGFYEGKQS